MFAEAEPCAVTFALFMEIPNPVIQAWMHKNSVSENQYTWSENINVNSIFIKMIPHAKFLLNICWLFDSFSALSE